MPVAYSVSPEDQRKLTNNSQVWQEATKAGNQALANQMHADSEAIRGGYGYSGGQDGSEQIPLVQRPKLYEQEIKDMNAARTEEAIAGYTKAYQNSLAELNRTQQTIAPKYQEARNQSAGSSEQEKRAFAEYAAARGLNSGAGGQAELARNNALQASMGGINRGEADAYADIATQRSKLATEYEFAIAQARAQGNFQEAQGLYNEYIRHDNAMRDFGQWASNENRADKEWDFTLEQDAYRREQDALNRTERADETQYSRGRDTRGDEERMAQFASQFGIFGGYGNLGADELDVAQMQRIWQEQYDLDVAASKKALMPSPGGGNVGGNSQPEGIMSLANVKWLEDQGYYSPEFFDSYQYHFGSRHPEDKRGGVSSTTAPALNPYPVIASKTMHPPNSFVGGLTQEMALEQTAQDILNRLQRGEITQTDAMRLMDRAGIPR